MRILPEAGPRDFQRAAEVLFSKGWAEASAGNMSLRLAEGTPALRALDSRPGPVLECAVDMAFLAGEQFLVTASGSRMRELAADPVNGLCLVEVLDRRRYRVIAGAGRPTSEWATHAGLHSLFKESGSPERAILHCHPLNLIALSHVFHSEKEMNGRISRMHHETLLFVPEMLGLVRYAVTGSLDLAKATREKMKKFRIALWDKHGVIASGRDLDEALDRVEMVEKAAAVYLRLKSAGLEPEGLSDDQVEATLRSMEK
ncbi:MAG: rhamnulose-1-phosphate aldolase [Acidobacteriota bacterium]|nr:rhamnulose-1-phosphate aldolase [Acidobacteriota bacterium]